MADGCRLILWLLQDFRLRLRQDLSRGEWELEIRDVAFSDAGEYECQVGSTLSHTVTLAVLGKILTSSPLICLPAAQVQLIHLSSPQSTRPLYHNWQALLTSSTVAPDLSWELRRTKRPFTAITSYHHSNDQVTGFHFKQTCFLSSTLHKNNSVVFILYIDFEKSLYVTYN